MALHDGTYIIQNVTVQVGTGPIMIANVIDLSGDNKISAYPLNGGMNQKWTIKVMTTSTSDSLAKTTVLIRNNFFTSAYLGLENQPELPSVGNPLAPVLENMAVHWEIEEISSGLGIYRIRLPLSYGTQRYCAKGMPDGLIALALADSKDTSNQLWVFEEAQP